MRTLRLVALVCYVGFVGSCGGSTALSTSTGDPCTDQADAICNLRSSCSKGEYVTQSYGDLATCVARTKLQCNASINAPDSNKTPAAVEACAKAYVGFSCASYFDGGEPTACIFVGSRANGATCAFAAQCSSGFCTNTKVALCGVCADMPPAGASCATSACGSTQSCNGRTSTCVTRGIAGASCNYDAQPCGFGFMCPNGSGTAVSTCVAENGSSGDSCGGSDGKYCEESDGVTCQGASGDRSCKAATFASDGEPCGGNTTNGVVECGAGGQCYENGALALSGVTGTCKAAAADGAACDIEAGPPCLTPARCVVSTDGGTTGVCTVPSASGC